MDIMVWVLLVVVGVVSLSAVAVVLLLVVVAFVICVRLLAAVELVADPCVYIMGINMRGRHHRSLVALVSMSKTIAVVVVTVLLVAVAVVLLLCAFVAVVVVLLRSLSVVAGPVVAAASTQSSVQACRMRVHRRHSCQPA